MSMNCRVQVVLDDQEREEFRRQAAAEGLSLSAWLRLAGRRRVEAERRLIAPTAEGVRRFFADLPLEPGKEPDWEDHRSVLEASQREGLASS